MATNPTPPKQDPNGLLTGVIEVIGKPMFYNEQTRYAIVKAKNPDKGKEFVFKGVLDHPTSGSRYEVQGYMEQDASRGNERYFKIKSSKPLEYMTKDGWIQYIQREGPNVGEVRAIQLVELFGAEVVEVLANQPSRAANLPGLTPERLKQLSEWAKAEQEIAGCKKMLYGINLTTGLVRRLIIHFGNNTRHIVWTDPFKCMEVDGIGFLTASKIAEAVGCPNNDHRRVRCGILHIMHEHSSEGHVCILWDRMLEKAQQLLAVGREQIINATKDLINEGALCTQRSPPGKFVKNHDLFPNHEGA